MAHIDDGADQDEFDAFDETHMDDEGDGDELLDEVNNVPDFTQTVDDADEEAAEENALDIDDDLALEGVENDSRLDSFASKLTEIDVGGGDLQGRDEVELVFSGLMENRRGAQASAAHWESRRLSDDDIDALGYGDSDTAEAAR